jgi:hypothetical protein
VAIITTMSTSELALAEGKEKARTWRALEWMARRLRGLRFLVLGGEDADRVSQRAERPLTREVFATLGDALARR